MRAVITAFRDPGLDIPRPPAAAPLAPARRAQGGGEAGLVALICPGGLQAGGGIGRQMEYFLDVPGQPGDPAYEVLDPRGAQYIAGSPWRALLAGLKLAAVMLRVARARAASRQLLLHVNLAARGSLVRKILLCAAARALRVPYLVHVHEPDFAAAQAREPRLVQHAARRMLHAARAIIVLGEAARADMQALGLARPEQLLVLPNAVARPAGACPLEADAPGGVVRLLFLGHLDARKGVPELLRALAAVKRRAAAEGAAAALLAWRLVLAGGGGIAEYTALARALGLAGEVTFLGKLDRGAVAAQLKAADVLVLPSHAEGLAIALLEGLAHGLAVVATPVGAHAEVIRHGESGLLVPPGDVDALADALARVMGDADLRARLRRGAVARHAEGFDIVPYAQCLRRLHARLLAGGAP